MERSNYRISLDIRDSHGACLLDMKRTDTHRRIYITLTDGGVPYRITEGCQVVFTAKKPDNKVIYNHCTVEDNTVIYDVTPQTTAETGLLQCEIRLYDASVPLEPDENGVLSLSGTDVQLLTSAAFGIRVYPTVYNEEDILASENEVSELTQLTDRAHQALQWMEKAKEAGEFDGISATHSWDGTVLTVTSASGTSSADLKGEKGEVNIDDTAVGPEAWSSKHLIDRLCPAFGESGGVVQCEPVEGYPMNIATVLPASEAGHNGITLTQCGKNLFDNNTYAFVRGYVYVKNGDTSNSSNYCYTPDYIDVSHLHGQTITLNHPPIEVGGGNPGMAFYDADKVYISGTNGYTITVPETAAYLRFSVPVAYIDGSQIQIELGGAVTEYEPYRERVFSVEFPEPVYGGEYDWAAKNIPALAGVNTFYSSTGNTRISGKADPVAIMEKLTQAILSLGGNI